MLAPVTAVQFHKPMGVGKTAPSLVTCGQEDQTDVEVVVKFAAGCEICNARSAGLPSAAILAEAIAPRRSSVESARAIRFRMVACRLMDSLHHEDGLV